MKSFQDIKHAHFQVRSLSQPNPRKASQQALRLTTARRPNGHEQGNTSNPPEEYVMKRLSQIAAQTQQLFFKWYSEFFQFVLAFLSEGKFVEPRILYQLSCANIQKKKDTRLECFMNL